MTGSAVPALGGLTEPAPQGIRAHAGRGAAVVQVWGVRRPHCELDGGPSMPLAHGAPLASPGSGRGPLLSSRPEPWLCVLSARWAALWGGRAQGGH